MVYKFPSFCLNVNYINLTAFDTSTLLDTLPLYDLVLWYVYTATRTQRSLESRPGSWSLADADSSGSLKFLLDAGDEKTSVWQNTPI